MQRYSVRTRGDEGAHSGHRRRGGDPRFAADDPRVRGLRRARGVERARRASRSPRRESPDLVFLDVKMPGMDGLEVLQRIKAVNETLPVVIISGHGTVSTAVEATKAGAFDFIEKPLASERVLRHDPQRARPDAGSRDENRSAQARRRSAAPDGRREPGAAAGLGRDQARGADQRDRAAPRRERRRQGAGGARRSTATACAAASGSCR